MDELVPVVAGLLAKTLLLVFKEGDIPVCSTRPMRGGRGMLWEKMILVHPRDDRLEVRWAEGQDDSTAAKKE